MKRILLLISAVVAFNSTFAQQVGTSKSINFTALEKKVAKSNADIENPKKNIKEATWISRAELMLNIYNSEILNAYVGMTPDNFNLIIGKPNEQSNDDIDGVSTDKYIMDRVTFFFVEGKLSYWQVTNPVVENPLDIALECLQKAIEIDVKGSKAKKISEHLLSLTNRYSDNGLNYYMLKEYDKASKEFQKSVEVSLMPQVNKLDTAIYYYAALSAQLGKNYEEAVDLYKKSLEYGFYSQGETFYYLYGSLKEIGKEDEGMKYLEEGLVKYPQNLNILYSLISCYLAKGDDPSKIISYIDKALVDEPTNYSLYFAKGTLLEKLEQPEEAVAAYTKAIEMKPDYFDACYNIGAVYYNIGVKIEQEALKLPVSKEKEYDECIARANVEYKKSIPYMIKATEINPQSKEAVEAVMNLYFRYRNESEEMMNLYKKYKEMHDAL